MDYISLRQRLMDELNRSDLTESKADDFISLGVGRLSRLLRTAFQKRRVVIPKALSGGYIVPSDLMSIIAVRDDKGIIPRVGSVEKGHRGFCLTSNKIHAYPEGEDITVDYWCELQASPTEPFHVGIIPDLLLYTALVFAAIHYVDERKDVYDAMMKELLMEVRLMSDELELSGQPVIRNPYEGIV